MLRSTLHRLSTHTHTRRLREIILTKCRSLYHMHPLPQQTAHYFPTGMHFWRFNLSSSSATPPPCAMSSLLLVVQTLHSPSGEALLTSVLVLADPRATAVPLSRMHHFHTTTPTPPSKLSSSFGRVGNSGAADILPQRRTTVVQLISTIIIRHNLFTLVGRPFFIHASHTLSTNSLLLQFDSLRYHPRTVP